MPEPVSAKKKDKLVIPLGIVNDGKVDLNRIVLDSIIAKNGLLRSDLIASFDKSFIDFLPAGARENVTLIVDVDTQETGIFEITINGTVEDPDYSDWGKLFIEIEKEPDVIERIIFIEEFIIGNPVCAELADVIEDAKVLLSQGKIEESREKAEQAFESCKQTITQPPSQRAIRGIEENIFGIVSIASLIVFVLGFIYYYYKRIKLSKEAQEDFKKSNIYESKPESIKEKETLIKKLYNKFKNILFPEY